MSDAEKTQGPEKPGLDSLIEDIFGLNLRGVKTVWVLFLRPSEVFAAALDPHWRMRFTPSIRLWFSLMAVLLFFQFLWTGDSSFMIRVYTETLEPMAARYEGVTSEELGELAAQYFVFLFPIMTGLFLLIAACFTFIWGKGRGFVTRLRLFFAGLIPDASATIVATVATALSPPHLAVALASLAIVLSVVVNGMTVYRGLPGIGVLTGRVWRAAVFVGVSVVVSFLASTTAQAIAAIYIGYQLEAGTLR